MIALLRRNGDFRAVFCAQIVSYCGDWFATVAMLGLVIDRTGSDVAATAVIVVQTLPSFALSPLAGPKALYVGGNFTNLLDKSTLGGGVGIPHPGFGMFP